MERLLLVSLWFFVLTHLDTLVLLVAFCADERYDFYEVLVGHYLGFSTGLAVALVGAFVATQALREYSFVLGIVPVALGLWGVLRRRPSSVSHKRVVPSGPLARIGVVALAGVGLSGENVAVFVPFFVTLTNSELVIVTVGYLALAGVTFVLAYGVARFTVSAGLPQWVENWVAPVSLIVIGVYVLSAGWIAG